MKYLLWLKTYWYIPLLLIVAVFGYVWLRGRRVPAYTPMDRIKKELEAIQAAKEAREMRIQLGTEQALQHVKDKYQAKREALDAKQEAKAKTLEQDPVALAKYLERLTR